MKVSVCDGVVSCGIVHKLRHDRPQDPNLTVFAFVVVFYKLFRLTPAGVENETQTTRL